MVYSNKYKFRKLRGTVQDSINEERARQNADFNRKLKNAEDSMKAIYPEEYQKIRSRYFGNGNNLGLIGSQYNYIHDMITRRSDDQMKKYYNELNDYFIKQNGTEPGYMLPGVDVHGEYNPQGKIRDLTVVTPNSDYLNTVSANNAKQSVYNSDAGRFNAGYEERLRDENPTAYDTWERAQNSPIVTAMEFSPLFPVVAGVKAAIASDAPQASGVDVGMNAAFAALPAIGIGAAKLPKIIDNISRFSFKVPNDPNRYYRIVGKSGDPIGDAIKSGVIRGPGATEELADATRKALRSNNEGRFLLTKAHEYPMFSKGKPWSGSTARAARDRGTKPIIIRSKSDTGPIVWEQSNIDFRHKGHNGIYRPNYYGDNNASPTQFFEYFEPLKIGYIRRDFPKSNVPSSNFMGYVKRVDGGPWKSDISIDSKRFGEYIGDEGEQTVFIDHDNNNKVLKVYNDTYLKNINEANKMANEYQNRRNAIPLQEPIRYIGTVDDSGYIYPVFSQNKLKEIGDIDYQNIIKNELKKYGYIGDGINTNFTDGNKTLIDIKPENIGIDKNGSIKFIDVDNYRRDGSTMGEFADGGIHIKESHRGRLTRLKERTGKSEEELYRTGDKHTRQMITFARNARKWKHADGGDVPPFKSFDDWYRSIYHNATDTTDYNLRRAYELAPIGELEAWRLDPDKNHLHTGYWNGDVYEFMKSKDHPTVNYELDWYNSPDADDFRSRYMLDTTTGNYKYVPRYKVKVTF